MSDVRDRWLDGAAKPADAAFPPRSLLIDGLYWAGIVVCVGLVLVPAAVIAYSIMLGGRTAAEARPSFEPPAAEAGGAGTEG